MKKSNFCSIIIVTYNSCASVRDCLRPFATVSDLEVIVVDNNSQDGSVTLVEEEFPSVKVIALQENLGFGCACNIGVAASRGSFLVLLNPDAVTSSKALEILATFLEEHPRAGIAGARLIDPLGCPLQSMGDRPSVHGLLLDKPMTWIAKRVGPRSVFRTFIGRVSSKFRFPTRPEPVSWVSGAALCCRRSAWDDLRGFDENFFLYYEDVDFCLRSIQAGWEVWHVPEAVVSHQSGASFAGNQDFQKKVYFANQQYFFQKHCGYLSVFFLSTLQTGYRLLKLYRHLASDRIGPPV